MFINKKFFIIKLIVLVEKFEYAIKFLWLFSNIQSNFEGI